MLALLVAGVSLGACGSGASSRTAGSSPTTSRPAPTTASPATTVPASINGTTGVRVTGAFDTKPSVTFPATSAPKQLIAQTVVAGTGSTVASGDTVIMNYQGDVWPTKVGAAPKVFDSSFSRRAPTGFVIGTGAVIPGFDKTLVGRRLGSRLILSIPPADGYGSSGNSQAGISGTDTLVFVIDLLSDFKPSASAPGTVDSQLPATGWPKITNTPAHEPSVTSVAGVKAPSAPTSKLLVKGSGAKIDPTKTLVLQLVQTDIPTGKQSQSSWGKDPQLVSAKDVLSVAAALNGQSIGARAVVLLPATAAQPASATASSQPASPAQILIIDVVGQF